MQVELGGATVPADAWAEHLRLDGAEVKGTFVGGPGDGLPAITRHAHGDGVGWYVGTRLGVRELEAVIAQAYADAGIQPPSHPQGVEVMVRRGEDHDYVVAVNHGEDEAEIRANGTDLLTGAAVEGVLRVGGGGAAVVRTSDLRGGDR